jgi:hypothetical protein
VSYRDGLSASLAIPGEDKVMGISSVGAVNGASGAYSIYRSMQAAQANRQVRLASQNDTGLRAAEKVREAGVERRQISETGSEEVLVGDKLQQAMTTFLHQLGSGINGLSQYSTPEPETEPATDPTGSERARQRNTPPESGSLITGLDQDGNGSVSTSEVRGPLASRVGSADSDRNGQVSASELRQDMETPPHQTRRPAQAPISPPAAPPVDTPAPKSAPQDPTAGADTAPASQPMATTSPAETVDQTGTNDAAARAAVPALDTNQDGGVNAEEQIAAGRVEKPASAYATSRLGAILKMLFPGQQGNTITATV